ncbi:MAG: hypothetical protein EA350_07660 [Gemmatimonadales bacterium]|nr:MAG: hypothetical protein EA350_07660 [Gemmatimonadales bacterium]
MSSFVERSPLRLLAEAVVGGTAGWLLSNALGVPEASRPGFAVAGAVLAPIALLLTPLTGSTMGRALRYGGAVAVLGMLALSFTGPGRERPVGELLALGILLLGIGTVGHGILLVASGGDGGHDPDTSGPGDSEHRGG